MQFDFTEDQIVLGETVRRLLDDACPAALVRGVIDDGEPYARQLWSQLGELGFLGAAIPEIYGGAGLGYLELCVIAEALGRSIAPVPASTSIYQVAETLLLAGSEEQKRHWLPRLASGAVIGTLGVAERTGRATEHGITASVQNGRLSGSKIAVTDGAVADVVLVAAREAGGVSLFLVETGSNAVQREPAESLDPSRPLASLHFDAAPAERIGMSGAGWALVQTVRDRAAVLLAFEQVGGADRALQMARDYALERMAFARPIGSFQAIKHMLADMYVSATLARSNAYYGAWALSTDAPELPEAAATARISASQAFLHCARNNIQVHGGMGFTWEFDCHLYYRRANALALSLGGSSLWEDLLIERMQLTRLARIGGHAAEPVIG